MSDSYNNLGPSGTSGIDELLCEYVDGTMEPDVRAVFEECLHADEELAQEVHRLRNARSALSQYGVQRQAPERAKRRLRNCLQGCLQEAAEQKKRSTSTSSSSKKTVSTRLRTNSTLIGAVTAAFVAGLCAGGLLFGAGNHADFSSKAPVVEKRTSAPTQPSFMSFPALRFQPMRSSPADSTLSAPLLLPAARQP